jgi:hypothetical protein
MKEFLLLATVMFLVGCASKPRPVAYSYATYTAPSTPYYVPYTPPRPVATQYVAPSPKPRPLPRLSYEDLIRFESDCNVRTEQIALLEEQLKRTTFYNVGGVEGNTTPNKISKSYYALAKYRIWTLRLGCQGSEVQADVVSEDRRRVAIPNQAPQETRCYFEERVETKANSRSVQYLNAEHTTVRRELCTNHPYITDRPFIRMGDQLNFAWGDVKTEPTLVGVRRWRGNLYQMIPKTEMHQNQAVRFTLVVVRTSANQWTVVDKF